MLRTKLFYRVPKEDAKATRIRAEDVGAILGFGICPPSGKGALIIILKNNRNDSNNSNNSNNKKKNND